MMVYPPIRTARSMLENSGIRSFTKRLMASVASTSKPANTTKFVKKQ